MNSDVLSLPKADGQILTFDIPDEVLERAATPRTTSLHFGVLHSPLVQLRLALVAGRSNSPNIGITAGAGGFWILSSPRNPNPPPPHVFTAGPFGFLTFTQYLERPELYVEPSRLLTIPSQPSWQAR